MRNVIFAAALSVAAGSASAQSKTVDFQLFSTNTNSVVGGGKFTYTVQDPSFVFAGTQFIPAYEFSPTAQLAMSFSDVFITGLGQTFYLGLRPQGGRFQDGEVIGVDGEFDNSYGTLQEVFYLRGSFFYQDSYRRVSNPNYTDYVPFQDRGTIIFASAVPEPSTYALMLGGIGMLAVWRRRNVS